MSIVSHERDDANATGLICPRCECADSRVVYTRHVKFRVRSGKPVAITRRLHECRHCGRRFYSSQRVTGEG